MPVGEKMRKTKKLICLVLAVCLVLSLSVQTLASGAGTDSALKAAEEYVLSAVPEPQVGSIGGEWAVIGLARGGAAVPDGYFDGYYSRLEATLRELGGVLHRRKYTEYSRVILAVTAIGHDARSVAGYDLTLPLGDYDATVLQGLNGPIWALIALDSGNYPIPGNPQAKTQATRQLYVDCILSAQGADGGWSLDGGESGADMTAMALQALAKYSAQPAVSAAIDRALGYLSDIQYPDGGYASDGEETAESCAQVLVALCENGISPDDARFVKNGSTVLDALLSFSVGGGFEHTRSGGANQMASEQGLYALAAAYRAENGMDSLYTMSSGTADEPAGEPTGGQTVNRVPVTKPGVSFADIAGHKNQAAIEDLASRGIINGKSADSFDPDAGMTRAEFSAIVVRALGLEPKAVSAFDDVPAGKWYAAYVGTAYTCGIVNGVGERRFDPDGPITRQEAAVMVSRAARLCGMDPDLGEQAVSSVLSRFTDGGAPAEWARQSLAFCYSSGLMPDMDTAIEPARAILRCEIAQLLYELLGAAALL